MVEAVANFFEKGKSIKKFKHVKLIAKCSYLVENKLKRVGDAGFFSNPAPSDAFHFDVTNESLIAWLQSNVNVTASPILRGKRARWPPHMLVDVIYLAYATCIAMINLPDWIYTQCQALEELGDEYDDLRMDNEQHASSCEDAAAAALDLQKALEDGDLEGAFEAIDDGTFFLDIGFVKDDEGEGGEEGEEGEEDEEEEEDDEGDDKQEQNADEEIGGAGGLSDLIAQVRSKALSTEELLVLMELDGASKAVVDSMTKVIHAANQLADSMKVVRELQGKKRTRDMAEAGP